MRHKVLVIVCLGLQLQVSGVVVGQAVGLFDVPPEVTLSVSSNSFEMFEPVVVTISVTNSSNRLQFYEPFNSPRTPFIVRLDGPDGYGVRVHDIYFYRGDSAPLGLGQYTPFAPGETRSYELPLNLNFPLWTQEGLYVIQFVSSGSSYDDTYEAIAAQTFSVTRPAATDSTTLEQLRAAADLVFNQRLRDTTGSHEITSSIDLVLAEPSATQHMREFAAFASALHDDLVDLSGDWAGFVAAHPSSPWSVSADSGLSGMLWYYGMEPYELGWESPTYLAIRVLLEGAATGSGTMQTSTQFRNVVRLSQPYDTADWYFESVDTLDSRYPWLIDWVLVTLIDSTASNDPDTVVARAAAPLDVTGAASLSLFRIPSDSFYVVVEHRNHLAVASDTLVDFTNGYAEHDFTTGHAYGLNAQKQIVSGTDTVYAMFAGDADPDGAIDINDFAEWLRDAKSAAEGYLQSDMDLSGEAEINDYARWLSNAKTARETNVKREWGFGYLPASPEARVWSGGSAAAPKTEAAESARAKFSVTGHNTNDDNTDFLQVAMSYKNIGAGVDTAGGLSVDIYYNSDEYEYDYPLSYTEWYVNGYEVWFEELENEYGDFIRVLFFRSNASLPGVTVDQFWTRLFRVRFDGLWVPFTGHEVGIDLDRLGVGLFEGSGWVLPDIAPEYLDAFTY